MDRLSRRSLLAGSAALGLGLTAARPGAAAQAPAERVGETVRDRLWLWCHAAGAHTRDPAMYGLTGESAVTPAEGAQYMGLRNVLMVRHGADLLPPTPETARTVAQLDRVVWGIEGGGGEDVEGALAVADTLPNLRGLLMDDYLGRVPQATKPMWLAGNHVTFPVTWTATFAEPVTADRVEVAQSAWRTGDYRTRGFAVDLTPDGADWTEAAAGTLPNEPGATVVLDLPRTPLRGLHLRILGTHDTQDALSCGLSRVRLWAGDRDLLTADTPVEASSEYPGHPAGDALRPEQPADETGPFSLGALQRLRARLDAAPRRLDLWVVLYTGEFGLPFLRPHLDLCDVVTMWTWAADDLAALEQSLARCEEVIGDQRKVLGLYMWDYGARRPIPLAAMEAQCDLGLRWLREGRLEAMIFLASCLCDLDLEAVEWTRDWIAAKGAERL